MTDRDTYNPEPREDPSGGGLLILHGGALSNLASLGLQP
jgi:hypothetical protein